MRSAIAGLIGATLLISPLVAQKFETRALASREPHSLAGFWNFSSPVYKGPLRVDKEWRLQGISGVESASFSVKILVPQHLRTGDFALILPPVSAAIRIQFNGKTVAERGAIQAGHAYPIHSSEAFLWYPVKLELFTNESEQELRLDIQGFRGGGGVYGNAHIYFGGIDEIRSHYNSIFLLTVFVAAAIFMIAVFHLVLVADHSYRRANLHYVLLSLAMSAHIIGMNGLGYFIWDNFLFNAALIHFLVAAFPYAMTGFTLRYFKLQYPKVRRVAYAYALAMALFLIMTAALPDLIPIYLNYVLPFGVVAMALSLVFVLVGAIRGLRKKIDGAKLVFFGFLAYGIGVINDVAFYFSYATPIKMADAGFLVAVICVAFALALRLRKSVQEQEELRDWQKEIALAAQIQNLALPQRSLDTGYVKISTLFKPMKMIGGDFFSFHRISDAKTGIFIADVSGHGIAAALLVSTLRSIFYQQRELADRPALFLEAMNKALYPHLHEQFVTAAYCVIDSSERKIRVAQAGHPPIYLVSVASAAIDKAKPRGKFFGFAPDSRYEESELPLSQYSRIFLYSDGVIEAGALAGKPYSATRLENFLMQNRELDETTLLQKLEIDIFQCTGVAMNTDDDSSCIVADLLSTLVSG